MKAGRLRHRVMLQRSEKHQDTLTGAIIDSWVDVAKLWAEIYPLSGKEFVSARAVQSEITARITIRYRADVTSKHRFIYRGKIYNISGVLPDPVSGLEYMTLPCSEGVNDG
ncbi:phage head closure protein [Entomohabitans teleogrylli]|uniref:phage head closure protein n=1 Tax=Entomohabitans teleogrylli TaxID=1384589 RepID=UPI00073DA701|nr:phage head closure protein [Entomohabitans teleogrylli]